MFDLGILPGFAPGGHMSVGLTRGALELVMSGALFAPQRQLVAGTQRGGDFGLALVR